MIAELGFIIAMFVVVLAAGSAADASAGQAKWPTLGGSFQRTGWSQDQGPVQGGLKWKYEISGAVLSSVTVGADGRIHVACEDGRLYTLGSDGKPVWIADVNMPLASAPTIGPDGGLYVGSETGQLVALDPEGGLRWTYRTGDAIYAAPAVASDGAVYVGSSDGTLYALDPNGTELWRFTTKGPGRSPCGAILASPSLAVDGTVYVAGLYDPNLYALNPADGSIKWACRFPPEADEPSGGGWPFAAPVVAADGTIYETLLYDRHLYAIDPTAGAIRWAADLCDPSLFGPDDATEPEGSGWSEPVIGPDGTVYVSLDDPYLRAVDPGGTVKWVRQLGEAGAFTLTVDRTGVIYAASDNGYVFVVAPDGAQLARFDFDGWPLFPVLAGDDLLILADSKDYSAWEAGGQNMVWAISSNGVVEAPVPQP
jgi:outer membrane protein assembly factor BamB